MRITGFAEDEEGNGFYLVEWIDAAGRKLAVLYSEADGASERLAEGGARSLLESGELETCSLPASEILFPDEMKTLAGLYEDAAEEEKE